MAYRYWKIKILTRRPVSNAEAGRRVTQLTLLTLAGWSWGPTAKCRSRYGNALMQNEDRMGAYCGRRNFERAGIRRRLVHAGVDNPRDSDYDNQDERTRKQLLVFHLCRLQRYCDSSVMTTLVMLMPGCQLVPAASCPGVKAWA